MMEQFEPRQLLAPVAQLIADLDGYSTGSTNPSAFQDAGGGQTIFRASSYPSILWRTDGTALGTVQLATGLGADFERIGNLVFYLHEYNDGFHSPDLWRTDGTAAGTIQLQNFDPGQTGSKPSDLTSFNGSLAFVTTQPGGLWRSDGTVAGTVLVKDSISGLGSVKYGHHLTNVNGTLFFHPDSGPYYASEGTQLWKSDGTAAGTVSVKNFAGTGNTISSSDGDDFFNFNGKLLFRTNTGKNTSTRGYNLWISDGTDTGTVLLKSITDRPQYWQEMNGIVYFGTAGGLWKTDGTPGGTTLVSSVKPSGASAMANINGTLLFSGDDGVHGPELWKSDGTAAGTVMVKDVNTVSCCSGPSGFVNWNGNLLFVGNDGVHGGELWLSDGTDAGTQMVTDINPGSASGVTGNPAVVNGTVFFSGQDPAHGSELWKMVDLPQPAPVNVPPSAVDGAVRAVESATYAFQVGDFGFSDAADNSPDHFQGVKINTLPGGGSLTNNNTAVIAGQLVPSFDIAQGRLRYAPTAGKTGLAYASFTFQVQDDGGTSAGGSDLATSANAITINVAPALKVLEDVPYVFTPTDFGLTGIAPPDSVTSVAIASLPAAGGLSLSGVAVTLGQIVAMSDVVAGNLTYRAAANANGNAYARFTYQLTSGGLTNTIDINVAAVNDPPTGVNATLTTNEDTPYYIKNYELGFNDPNDKATPNSTGQSYFANVIITSITGSGQLGYRFGTITSQSQLPITISVPDFDYYTRFVPDPNTNGTAIAQIGFKVQDGGGTALGGLDTDLVERTLTINVNSVNDRPSGADKTITTPEDTLYTLALGDFGFSDPSDTPPNAFIAVKLDSQPTRGSLRYNGTYLSSELISVADLTAGKLQYFPPANVNGPALDKFTFRVEDSGGLAGGGRNMDGLPNTITFNLSPVNDPPAGTSRAVNLLQNTTYVLGIADFGFSDSADVPPTSSIVQDNLSAVIITSLPAAGSLTDDNVAVSAGQVIPVSDIAGGKLRFAPAADATGSPYASIGFAVQDTGGTALGGKDVDPAPKTLTIQVVPPPTNQEPTGADATFEILEDATYTFQRSDFGFRDPGQSPANNLLGVTITTRPALGVIIHNGLPALTGEFVPVVDIDAGQLKFVPAGNGNGLAYTSFTFQVQDDGGTASGGIDLDSTPNTISFRVDAVSDAPAGKNTTVDYYPSYALRIADFGFSDLADDPAVNRFLAVKTTTLPTAGSLKNNGVAVTAGQFIPVSDITAGRLQYSYSGSSNFYSPFASFTFQVQDDGGTALGGADLDPTPKTILFQTYLPCGCPATAPPLAFPENRTSEFTLDNFWFSGDQNPVSIRISLQSSYYYPYWSIRYNNQSVDPYFGTTVPISDIIAGKLTVSAPASGNTSAYLSYNIVYDNNSTDSTQTIGLYARPVNDPPVGADKTFSLPSSGTYTFGLSDFYFNDYDGNKLQSVTIQRLRESGVLLLDGNVVPAGQSIDPASIAAGKLTFSQTSGGPVGTRLDAFTFHIKDDGGTVDGGRDTESVERTMSFAATAVNKPPQGTDKTAYALEDVPYTLQTADFGFTDPQNTPPNNFLAVKIGSLPSNGALTLSGAPVTAGQVIPVTSFSSLTFVPAANAYGATYDSFTFQVQDDAAQLGGGSDLDLTPNKLTINVTAINDAPAGHSATITLPAGSTSPIYTFDLSDFGFVDPNDNPADALSYMIVTPVNVSAGSLLLNGTARTSQTFVSASDITSGKFQYRPPATPTAISDSFTFRVTDNGGTYNGGVDTDPSAETLTLNTVAGINHAPSGMNHTSGVGEDYFYTFSLADFPFNDNDGNIQSLLAVEIATLPAAGSLTLASAPVAVGQFISAADIADGNLQFLPDANTNGYPYASFTFQVQDDGGTAASQDASGVDLDPTPNTFTINVISVNDPPHGSDKTIGIVQSTTYRFAPADFDFSDPNDNPPNNFLAVTITTIPTAGSLTLNGSPVANGQSIPVNQISSLVFTASADAFASPYTSFAFQVQDNGGTASGGSDLDPTSNTITINVVSRWHNPKNQYDVDGDGQVVAADALALINYFLANGLLPIPDNAKVGPPFYDVNNDQSVTIVDINMLIAYLSPGSSSPASADETVSIYSNQVYTFSKNDFAFTDYGDYPQDNLKAVQIATLPSAGKLRLDNQPIVAGQFIAVQDVSTGKLTYAPASGDFGSPYSSFTFRVQDDGGTATGHDLSSANTITINVAPINQPPAFSKGADVQVLDIGGLQSIDAWAKSISPGPPNEVGQNVHFLVTNDNSSLFSLQPEVDATGKLKFQPALGATGISHVTVTAIDDGGTANGGIDTSLPQTFTIGVSLDKPLHNRAIAADVTTDGNVVAEDALDVINFIHASGSGPVAPAKPGDPHPTLLYDVTGDNYIAADDVMTIINYISAHPIIEQEAGPVIAPDSAEADDEALFTLLATDSAAQAKRRPV
jgi:ELWxxDGT repeat protein